jgi:hypothetical protein
VLAGHYRLDAVRGHLLDMLGDNEAADAHYHAAAARTTNEPDRPDRLIDSSPHQATSLILARWRC